MYGAGPASVGGRIVFRAQGKKRTDGGRPGLTAVSDGIRATAVRSLMRSAGPTGRHAR